MEATSFFTETSVKKTINLRFVNSQKREPISLRGGNLISRVSNTDSNHFRRMYRYRRTSLQQPATPYIFVQICTYLYQNSILEGIKSRLRSRNACYHSVQNLLSSRLLS